MGEEVYSEPEHVVNLDDYWIDQTEVTNAMFERFALETGYETIAEASNSGIVYDPTKQTYEGTTGANWRHPFGPSSNLDGLEDHPVVTISWIDATAYCAWAGVKLPTEAQWEKAARGADGRLYPWGNQKANCDLANFSKCVGGTSPVGSYLAGASPYGLLDMAGNVSEWVRDWFDGFYYSDSPAYNPTGPTSGDMRVFRGGDWWDYYESDMKATIRYCQLEYHNDNSKGFRCAFSAD